MKQTNSYKKRQNSTHKQKDNQQIIQDKKLEIIGSRELLDWLKEEEISIAFTTYQTSRLGFLGVSRQNRLSGFERIFNRAMGLYANTESIYLSTKYTIWQFKNVLKKGQFYEGYDKLYIPRIGYTTGDLDIHDLVIDKNGKIIFISTLLNCIATVSEDNSCTPLWHPPFISKIVNEDRCHLNGLAMMEGKPRYVTVVGQSDVVAGWRQQRQDGGCVIDITTNEIITTGLSMPHSPRWYQGRLWLLNSGKGEFGYLDLESGRFEAIAFCQGYVRGLTFWKNFAIVGLSKPRSEDKTFSGLALDDILAAKNLQANCGLMAINLNTGAIVHWVHFEGIITELYDVQVLSQVQMPMALGFQTDEISRILTIDPLESL